MLRLLSWVARLLQVALNPCRRVLRVRRCVVVVWLVLLPCVVLAWLKLQEAVFLMHTRDHVNTYMAWWGQVCENATRGQREERARAASQGLLPLCACVDKYPVFTDGLAVLG